MDNYIDGWINFITSVLLLLHTLVIFKRDDQLVLTGVKYESSKNSIMGSIKCGIDER